MLYHLFEWFKAEDIRFPGRELFSFITFRVLLAVILSLFFADVSFRLGRNGISAEREGFEHRSQYAYNH